MSNTQTLSRQEHLAADSIGKLMRKFAMPAIISSLVSSLYNIVDQIFVGQSVGPLGNAATNVAFPLVIIVSSVSMLIGIGGASSFSLYEGGGDHENAGNVIGNSLSLCLLSGIFICLVVFSLLDPMMYLFGARGQVFSYAREYTGITAFGIPFCIITSAASQLIRADGSPNYSMASTLSGAILNTILDPILIFGFNMGIRGAALATITGQIVSAIIVLCYFRKFKSIRLHKRFFHLRFPIVRRIASLGAAGCFNSLAVTVVQIVLNNTLGHYGELSIYGRDIPLACVGIVSKVNTIFTSVNFGISQSCQPIMGYNYGAGNFKRVKDAYKTAAIVVTMISTGAFICFQLFPRQIISIFGHGDALYYEFGIRYFRIFLFCTFITGIQTLTASFFSSIGKAGRGILIALSRQIILFLPLIIVLPMFMGIDGVLFSGPIADGASGVLSILLAFLEFKHIDKQFHNQTA